MKIAIIGAAYTGFAAAKHFKKLGHTITVTTTKESRKEELEACRTSEPVVRRSYAQLS